MNVLVIDGQGGNIGRQLVKMISEQIPDAQLRAVGTNSIATANMIKGGTSNAATGENSVVVCSRWADVIVGPIGIVIADAMMGEVTETMAAAVGRSNAVKVLIPMNRCNTVIAGVDACSTNALLDDALRRIKEAASNG